MKNIIFDIGNVLLLFRPDEYLDQYYDEKTKGDLMTIIFSSDEWIELDLGNLTINEVIDIFSKRNPHYKEEIHFVLKHWTHMMTPLEDNVQVVYELKEKGYPLYLLSNFHDEAINEMFNKYEFFRLFDGAVISSHEHMIKPEPRFYEILLKRYQLKGKDCIFIDDMCANVKAAEDFGIRGIHLGYKVNLKEELKKIGIL